MTKFLSVFAVLLLAGCSVFNIFQGSFSQEKWEIQKIVIKDKEFVALGELKKQALQTLQDQNQEITDSPEQTTTQEPEQEATEYYKEDELSSYGLDSEEAQEEKPDSLQDLQELAQLEGISSFDFDVKQNKIFGVAGCNNFSADYAWKDADNIEIYDVNITRKLCTPSRVMVFEMRFARNLKNIFFVEKKGKDEMILKSKEVQIYLKAK